MASLRGAAQLEARLRAVGLSGEGMARAWAEAAVPLIQARIPGTGRERATVRVGAVSATKAEVVGSYIVHILDVGARAHDEKPRRRKAMRWQGGGRPLFAKRVHHPPMAARNFTGPAAKEAGATVLSANKIIEAWNLGA